MLEGGGQGWLGGYSARDSRRSTILFLKGRQIVIVRGTLGSWGYSAVIR